MKLKFFLVLLFALTMPLFALGEDASFVDDRAKFLSENDRAAFTRIATELRSKTGFSIYLYTAAEEVREPKALADSICAALPAEDSVRAVLFIDGSTHFRAFATNSAAAEIFTEQKSEYIAQNFLLPEFRQDRYAQGILVFEAEVAKYVARLKDVRLETQLPRPTSDGLPGIAWFLIFAVVAVLLIAFLYFSRQSSEAKLRGKIREFGGFPHNYFDSGFGG